jgi:hypothetical protein
LTFRLGLGLFARSRHKTGFGMDSRKLAFLLLDKIGVFTTNASQELKEIIEVYQPY